MFPNQMYVNEEQSEETTSGKEGNPHIEINNIIKTVCRQLNGKVS